MRLLDKTPIKPCDVKKFFISSGYKIGYKLLNAADYGVPQLRKRVFLVGHKNMFEYSFPKPIILKKDYRTVGETIMDLVNNKKIKNHVPMKHNDIWFGSDLSKTTKNKLKNGPIFIR